MSMIKLAAFLAVILLFSLRAFCSEDDGSLGDIDHADSLGGGQYITDSGKMFQTQDLGDGEYMTDGGAILQQRDIDTDELMTEDERMIQVEG
jgi:hypothetical protein